MIKTAPAQLLNLSQAARFLTVNPGTIRRWALEKKLKGIRIGTRGDWRFTQTDLLKMTRSNYKENISKDHVFYDIFQKVPAMIAVYNIRTGEYLFVNKAIKKLLGYKPEEFLNNGLSFVSSLVHPDDFPLIMEKNNDALKKANSIKNPSITNDSIVNFEYRMRHKNGRWVWLHSDGSVYSRDKSGKVECVMNVSVDITERKEKEEKALWSISESESKFKTLTDHAPVGIFLTDPTGNCLFVNEKWEQFAGMKFDEAMGMGWVKALYPEDKDRVAKEWYDATKNNMPFVSEYRFRTPNGKVTWLNGSAVALRNAKGKITGYLGTITDITQAKEAREEINKSEERFRIATDAGKVGVWDWDIINNRITWSDRVYEIHGLKKEEFDGTVENFSKLIYPEDNEIVTHAIQNALKNKQTYELEFRAYGPNKQVIWIFTRARVIFDKKNKPVRMLGAMIDITDRKTIEQRKDDFIALASHELETPITSLKLYAHIVGKIVGKGRGELVAHVKKMDEQIEKLNNLIKDLLDVSRIQKGKLTYKKEKFNINTLVKETVGDLEKISNGHKISIANAGNGSVFADRDRIKQVLINLITNGIKYSPKKKKIAIRIGRKNGEVIVLVRDFGVGIPSAQQSKIFEKFYQAEGSGGNTYPGLGLGLYISKEIVDRHNGRLWLKSQPGKGASFYFSLAAVK